MSYSVPTMAESTPMCIVCIYAMRYYQSIRYSNSIFYSISVVYLTRVENLSFFFQFDTSFFDIVFFDFNFPTCNFTYCFWRCMVMQIRFWFEIYPGMLILSDLLSRVVPTYVWKLRSFEVPSWQNEVYFDLKRNIWDVR